MTVASIAATESELETSRMVLVLGLGTLAFKNILSERFPRLKSPIDEHILMVFGFGYLSLAAIDFIVGNTTVSLIEFVLGVACLVIYYGKFGPPGLSFDLKNVLPKWTKR